MSEKYNQLDQIIRRETEGRDSEGERRGKREEHERRGEGVKMRNSTLHGEQ
jgi:hypothetical protein